ncbi:hypothetical protein EUTSA_v10024032mg [Eutrema salsugineum]|uniref:Flavin-containing monooxygenase n=1 Tax=Eutrema salsugineum TaxID=72664 RepID=V4JUU3_EUTSA|nr:hypothetical protein EUTSA_v10024032mg [Eutrema salsugineum]
MAPSSSSIKSHHVAVIGAGPGGLVAARELRREGHSVVVLERQNQVGGTWIYTDDRLPVRDPTRRIQRPEEVSGSRVAPQKVAPQLKDQEQNIQVVYKRASAVVRVSPAAESDGEGRIGKWRIESREKGKKDHRDEIYDAVVVCNGYYTEPCLAKIHGISSWPRKEMHSQNYRIPKPFKDQVVVLIGNSASADDISRDIARVAKEVHMACRSNAADTFIKQTGYSNIWMHSIYVRKIARVHEDSSVVFQNGKIILVDVIMHCTGYYSFRFLAYFRFEYNNWLASKCGCSGTEEWRKEMCLMCFMRKIEHPEMYRDEWEDHHLVSQAYQDFSFYV